MSSRSKQTLREPLDSVVRKTTNQLEAIDKSEFVRSETPLALRVMLVVPALAIGAQIIRWYLGFSPNPILSWPTWAILALLTPIGWLFARALTQQIEITRRRALQTADRMLGSTERLETADSFLQNDARNGFMDAAIEDASSWAQQGKELELTRPKSSPSVFNALWPIPVAAAAILFSSLLSGLERPRVQAEKSNPQLADEFPAPLTEPETPANRPEVDDEVEDKEETPRTKPEQRQDKAVNRQGSAGAAIPDTAEESSGKLSEGETRESQQSANPSNAKGSPSASGQPSKSGDETKRKKKSPKKSPAKEREKKEREQEDKPSGATAGQGSSKGSDNNAAPSDWASTSQSATPDDEDLEDEDQVDDEEEEQESRGGIQPNMRDRRTPVNRDLQIGFGSNRPNPDANGRGGPGGQKKSRGVASLVLGVPIPDRVNGQPNKGRIRITQQRITPEAESSQLQAAETRPKKSEVLGEIHHPQLTPWLHEYVKNYFLEQRAKHALDANSVSQPDES